jgi:hypothetical protein
MKQAICLIVNKPNEIYLEFLNKFINYHIIVVIDDNSVYYANILKNKYRNIIFFQLDNRFALKTGYNNSNTIGIRKLVSGWDKALFYFSNYNINYDFVWLIEDDVFFFSEQTIIDIDVKYPSYDLLANCDFKEGKYSDWLWSGIKINLQKPYYSGMMCTIRISKELLKNIHIYACRNKKLFFIEALFPTITIHNNLTYFQPDELTNIKYRFEWNIDVLDKANIYHPIKNQVNHIIFRNSLNSK